MKRLLLASTIVIIAVGHVTAAGDVTVVENCAQGNIERAGSEIVVNVSPGPPDSLRTGAMSGEAQTAEETARLEDARAFFDDWVARANAFDISAVEHYPDDAVVRTTRVYPFGLVRCMAMSGDYYKQIARQTLEAAKLRKDTNSFRDIRARLQGDRVIIEAMRHSNMKDYTAPYALALQRTAGRSWIIVEEWTATMP